MSDGAPEQAEEQKSPEERKKEAAAAAYLITAYYTTEKNRNPDNSYSWVLEMLKEKCGEAGISFNTVERLLLQPGDRNQKTLGTVAARPELSGSSNKIARFFRNDENEKKLLKRADALKENYRQHAINARLNRSAYPEAWQIIAGLVLIALAVLLCTSAAVAAFLQAHAFAALGLIALVLLVIGFIRGSFSAFWTYLVFVLVMYMAGMVVNYFRQDASGNGFFDVIQFVLAVPAALVGILFIVEYFREKRKRSDWLYARNACREVFRELYLMTCFSLILSVSSPTDDDWMKTLHFLTMMYCSSMGATGLTRGLTVDLAQCLNIMYEEGEPMPVFTEEEIAGFITETAAGIRKGA